MICRTCREDLDIKLFELRTDTKKYRTECKICSSNRKGFKSNIIKNKEYFDFLSRNEKQCSNCYNILDLDLFHKDKNTRSGYASRCKKCIKEIQSDLKDQFKNRTLKNRYGISIDDFNQMINNQENTCKICKDELINPFVDHCHKTGKVRGVLCNKCNSLLGYARDNEYILKEAIKYLKDT